MSLHQLQPLRIDQAETGVCVTLYDEELRESNLQILGDQLYALADKVGAGRFEVDLGEVSFLTSTGLGKLVALHKRTRERGGSLALTNLSDHVYEIFEVTQLHRYLNVRPRNDAEAREGLTPLAS